MHFQSYEQQSRYADEVHRLAGLQMNDIREVLNELQFHADLQSAYDDAHEKLLAADTLVSMRAWRDDMAAIIYEVARLMAEVALERSMVEDAHREAHDRWCRACMRRAA
jgi:hypothetical protein